MKKMVMAVLSKPEVAKIKFTLETIKIGSSSFQLVKSKIQGNKIKVGYSAKLGTGVAKYSYKKNTLSLGFKSIGGNADKEALIVHECTHAACDIAGKAMLLTHSEAAAYVAQALYFYYRNEVVLSKPGVKPTFVSALLREAWEVATKARANPKLGKDDIKKLLGLIAKHPLYKKRHSKTEAYDGV
jgi:hypothetical protein